MQRLEISISPRIYTPLPNVLSRTSLLRASRFRSSSPVQEMRVSTSSSFKSFLYKSFLHFSLIIAWFPTKFAFFYVVFLIFCLILQSMDNELQLYKKMQQGDEGVLA